MCKAFSCIVGSDKIVTWKLGVDSHTELLKLTNHKDQTINPREMTFARVEITPDNGSYLNPDQWTLKVDETITPAWWNREYESLGHQEHKKWLGELEKFLIRKEIVHPFQIKPPKIGKEYKELLKQWDSVWDSVRDSVRDSVGASVGTSVWDSVWAYVGSFFQLPPKASVSIPSGCRLVGNGLSS